MVSFAFSFHLKFFNCSVLFLPLGSAPTDSLPLFLTPPTLLALFTVDLHCGPASGVGSHCCCRDGRGVFPPALPSPPLESKHLCVAAGDVMAQKLLKAASLGNPISGSPDDFFLYPSLIVIAEQLGRDCEVSD